MAINFSQVKAITIPEGSVKQITDGQGNVLWKMASPVTKNVYVPLNAFATVYTTSGSNQYVKFNSSYLNQIKTYVANNLSISTSQIESITLGGLSLYVTQYGQSGQIAYNYLRLSSSTSSSTVTTTSIYSGSLRSEDSGDVFYVYTSKSSTVEINTSKTYYLWSARASSSSTPNTWYRTSDPSRALNFNSDSPSLSQMSVTVTYNE